MTFSKKFLKHILPWCAGVSAVIALTLVFTLLYPATSFAQSINLDLGQGPTTSAKLIQIILLITVLSLAPSILVMVTCFTRIIVVLSFLRTALGVQQTPPNVVLISLALFLTMFIMQPTFDAAWENGIRPLMNNQIDEETSFNRTVEPFHDFMLKHTRDKDLDLFMEIAKAAAAKPDAKSDNKAPVTQNKGAAEKDATQAREEVSLRTLIPAFMISELRRAFEIGFLLFLPFLIIDMVVASILMSMGMMMLPAVADLTTVQNYFLRDRGWLVPDMRQLDPELWHWKLIPQFSPQVCEITSNL